MTPELIALLAASLLGAGDFVGGLATRSVGGLRVAAVAQATGIPLLVPWALLSGGQPSVDVLTYGVAAGIAGSVGVAALYSALANGSMSVVAPLTAVGSVAVPVVGSVLLGEALPPPVQLLGVACAAASGGMAYGFGALRVGAGLVPSVLAAIMLGLWLILIDLGRESGGIWVLTVARVVGAAVLLVISRPRQHGNRGMFQARRAVLAGALDTGGLVLILLALGEAHIAVVAALVALYPLATIALAWLVLRERLRAPAAMAAVVALIGIVLITGPL